ncbi:MAG: diguanylate cyclase [Lachnospiraceae bacterium]|nr:diguanylate cyclase [Lachnospiraceae bacterium]
MIGIIYSIVGILAIIIHCIVNGDTLFINKKDVTSKTTLYYQRFLWGILLYYVTDALWGILDELGLINVLKADTFIYYIAMSLAVVLWTDYVVTYLNREDGVGKFVRSFGRLFLVFEVVALVVNIIYPFFFWFDENGTYHAGPIRYIALYIQIALFIASTIQTLYVAMNSHGVIRRRNLAISLFTLSMSAAIVAQIIYPLLPIYSIGYLIGACFLRVFVREDERDEYYKNLQREMNIVSSMAGIYFCSYYVDMSDRTFTQIENQIEENNNFIGEKGDAVETLDKMCKHLVLPEHRKEVQDFVNLDTLNERLTAEQRYISCQFESVHIGWAEGVFVAGDRDENGNLKHVIWAIRTINDEKKKEEKLLYNSYIDELTGLYNRKMYSEDTDGESNESLIEGAKSVDIFSDDFVFVSLDVNGLKTINDSMGHAAGDELLRAAASCMQKCIGPYGRVYRTGGDEFVALINASYDQMLKMRDDFEETTANYKGKYVDSVSVSYGYVLRKEYPELSIFEIEKMADNNMYLAKKLHYSSKGVDRRKQQQNAYKALCALYTKILMINITENTYSIISMDESEQTREKGFSDGIFEWLEGFAKSGQVHIDDQASYLAKTNREFICNYFKQDKTSLSISYRRKMGDSFKLVEMEIIPADSYSDDNQNMFLYVKNIDK